MNFNNIVTIGKKYRFLSITEDNCDNLFSFLRSKFKVKKNICAFSKHGRYLPSWAKKFSAHKKADKQDPYRIGC